MPIVSGVGAAAGVGAATGYITVKWPNELQNALKQAKKDIIIENETIAQRFSRLAYWQEARWWFIAYLTYKLLASAIARDYQLDADWTAKWTTIQMGGSVKLTPKK